MCSCSAFTCALLLALLTVASAFKSYCFHHKPSFSSSSRQGVFREKWINLKSFRRPSAVKEVDPGAVDGTKLRIIKYPNPKLREKNEVIERIDEDIVRIANEMLLVMHAMNGAGLAAPQVGINKRLMVMTKDYMDSAEDVIAINPTITQRSKTFWCSEEGCLSFPDLSIDVDRHTWVEVEYLNVKGEKVTKRLEEFGAILFQHEYDHLDQVLFIDRMVPLSKNSFIVKEALQKMIDDYGPGGVP